MATDAPLPSSLALIATAITVIFGDFAQEIASWIVCFDTSPGKPCKPTSKTDAIMMATLISTMVGIVSATAITERAADKKRTAILAVTGALLGAYFTLLKAAAEGADYPRWERLEVASYIYLVVILLFLAGPFLLVRMGAGVETALALIRRLAVAILIGSALGLIVQGLAELLWPLLYDPTGPADATEWARGSQKFLIAPGATVVATTAWGVLILDPWLRPDVWRGIARHRWGWLGGFGLVTLMLAGGYGAFVYAFEDKGLRPWLVKMDMGRWGAALADIGLILPGLAAFAIVFVLFRSGRIVQVGLAGLLAAALSASVTTALAPFLIEAGMMQAGDVPGFMASHGMAVAVIGASILLSDRIARHFAPVTGDRPAPQITG